MSRKDDGFSNFMRTNFPEIQKERDAIVYNCLYKAYLYGYQDATMDAVDSLKDRMETFND